MYCFTLRTHSRAVSHARADTGGYKNRVLRPGRRGALTSYWELKLKERLMESAVMLSAITEGGGRAAEEEEVFDCSTALEMMFSSWFLGLFTANVGKCIFLCRLEPN